MVFALCGVPLLALITSCAVEVFVRLKFAGALAPVAVAVTVYDPADAFAVNVGEVAMPLEFVVACAVVEPPVKVPLAPDEGAVNVTVTPLVGIPPVVTVATRGRANAVFTFALCGVPLVAEIVSELPPVEPGIPDRDPCCCKDPEKTVVNVRSSFSQRSCPPLA